MNCFRLIRTTISNSHNSTLLLASSKRLNPFFNNLQFRSSSSHAIINGQNNISTRKIIKLEPGLIQIKYGLSSEEQLNLAEIALKMGSRPEKGFYKQTKEGVKILNSSKHRGRMFDSLESFPKLIADLCQRNLTQAVQADESLKPVIPTHLILLYYKTLQESPKEGYIPWHQDNGENDGEMEFPVISFSIGDSCDFLINHSKPKISQGKPSSDPVNLAHRVLFESGDVLIFGGPCRKIWHSIYKIHADTAPLNLFIKGRLNFTFRYTPKIKGDEERFSTIDAEKLKNQPNNQFFRLGDMK